MNATPSFLRSARAWLLAAASVAALGSAVAQTADPIKPAKIAHIPLYADTAGDRPAMMLALSVEFPTVGAQYTGPENDSATGVKGYDPQDEYIGYYNHEMCYIYNTSEKYFEISRKGTVVKNASGEEGGAKCGQSKEFSGNFLNWATGSAIDMMRMALSGGDRVIDEEKRTVLQRAWLPDDTTPVTSVKLMDGTTKNTTGGKAPNNGNTRGPGCYYRLETYFPTKLLRKADGGGNFADAVPPEMVAAMNAQGRDTIYVGNVGNTIHFGVHEMTALRSGKPRTDMEARCGYGPYNYLLGAGGKLNEFHSVRRNSFFGTDRIEKQCAHGNSCSTTGGKPQRVWYGINKDGNRWYTGIVQGTFKCDDSTFGTPDAHGDTGETKPTTAARCYLEKPEALLSGDDFFLARVKVCDEQDVRDYGETLNICREYPSGHKKPAGAIQRHADDLRLAAFGYANDYSAAHNDDSYKGRFGGVLRAPMKYVGHNTYSPTGVKTEGNPRAEWDPQTGVFEPNPDKCGETDGAKYCKGASAASQQYKRSGVINYLNTFGRNPNNLGAYKQNDPVDELYYEAMRYMQGLQPSEWAVKYMDENTVEADILRDGFPAYTDWKEIDPFGSSLGYSENSDYSCVKASMVVVGDVNTGDTPMNGDKRVRAELAAPDDSKNVPNAHHWRNVVRGFEIPQFEDYVDGNGQNQTTSNPLGGNFSSPDPRQWVVMPGLAYWAHTHDIRGKNWTNVDVDKGETAYTETDENGNKTTYNSKVRPGLRLTTYTFDVNEDNREWTYDKRKNANQYWLAAKYGGYKTQPADEDDKLYNTEGNPYYDQDGNKTHALWSDLKKAQGGNTNGKANPEPRTYYMPANARGVLQAFEDIFSDTKPPANRSIGGADSTGGLSGASFQATFNGADWSGDVVSENVRDQTQIWSASEQLGKGEPRNIVSATHGDDGSTTAFDFTTGGTPSEVQELLDGDGATAAERIGWLRGDDRSKEGNGLRERSSLLGDIINSGVKYVGAPSGTVNLGDAFDAYVEAQADRQSVVYVGANDGMLHAFSADTGSELFAYIPSWMHGKLAALTDPKYIHQAYVDATPVIGDAKLNSATGTNAQASDWHTVLVGGTGGGGKGVYAIDVTNPTAFTKNNVLWEFTDADDPDMGYVLGQSRIVKLLTTKADANVAGSVDTYRWFAMVPAGVNNYVGDDATKRGNGDANIFLLALDKAPNQPWAKGSNYWKIQLPRIDALAATHPTGVLNLEAFTGVGGVTEYVYAGDLHGQLWALKFKGYETSDWNAATLAAPYVSGSKAVPLFVAKNANGDPQPITAAPTILEGAGNGIHFVSFGTGKYFESGDASTKYVNTFYTVYSNFTHTSASDIAGFGGTGAAVIPSRDHLQKVEQTEEDAATETTYFGPQSQFYWGWTATPTGSSTPHVRSGWYYDFAGDGEREVADATWISLTSRLMFSTLTPNSATETGVCGTGGGDSKLYTFDMVSGKGFRKSSTVGMLSQPLVFLDTEEATETEADSTGRRLRITPVFSGQFGSKGAATNQVDTVIVPFGRLSWRRIDNFQELYHEGKPSTATTGGNQ